MRYHRSRMRESAFRTLDPSQDALPTTWAEVRALTAPFRRDGESRSDQSHAVTAGRVADQDE